MDDQKLSVLEIDASRWRAFRRALATHDRAFLERLEAATPPGDEWLTEAEVDRIFDAALPK